MSVKEVCGGELCDHKGEGCGVESPKYGMPCTRAKGHEDPHIACRPSGHNYEVWFSEERCRLGDKCRIGFKEGCDGHGPDGRFCTREKGHDGPHIACGPSEHNIAIWKDED